MKGITRTNERIPPLLRDLYEYREICRTMDEEFDRIKTTEEKILRNAHAIDADTDGIGRFEKMFGITPDKDDTLESRRARVISYINGETPYTRMSLERKLDSILGKGNYGMNYPEDFDAGYGKGGYLDILIELTVKEVQKTVDEILRHRLPANMGFGTRLHYNEHGKIQGYKYTHRLLGKLTHRQIREEVIYDQGVI